MTLKSMLLAGLVFVSGSAYADESKIPNDSPTLGTFFWSSGDLELFWGSGRTGGDLSGNPMSHQGLYVGGLLGQIGNKFGVGFYSRTGFGSVEIDDDAFGFKMNSRVQLTTLTYGVKFAYRLTDTTDAAIGIGVTAIDASAKDTYRSFGTTEWTARLSQAVYKSIEASLSFVTTTPVEEKAAGIRSDFYLSYWALGVGYRMLD